MIDSISKLMDKQEPLHPDLALYLEKSKPLGLCLKHPLVFDVPYSPILNAMKNEQYKAKKELADKAKKEMNWGQYIFLHERPYRLQAFMDIQLGIDDDEYWKLLGDIWTDSENLWQHKTVVNFLLSSDRSSKEAMMDEEELKFFKSLPTTFTVYRGHQSKNKMGFSWTLSEGKAYFFAMRFCKNGIVTKGQVNKSDVIAYFSGRGENEIVVHPRKVRVKQQLTTTPITRSRLLDTVLEDCTNSFKLGLKSDHGPIHWHRVEKNALRLCALTPMAFDFVCRLFAYTHDSQRIFEVEDPDHGIRAAKFVEKNAKRWGLPKILGPSNIDLLIHACREHNGGLPISDLTIGVCWDADRLDLPRVGIITDPNLLSTQAAKKLLWNM